MNIFINLPVKDLTRSKDFFTKLGFTFNPQFTNDKGACLVISDTIYAMLLTETFFQTFTKKQIVDAAKSTEVMLALSTDSRTGVDEMIKKVISAGGKEFKEPQDYGHMYTRGFEDLDGHIWEVFWMDPKSISGK
jgi:predicted lactoylglutathione lyase